MSQPAKPESVKSSPLLRSLISYALVFLIAFLIGFIPMWLRSRESANNLAESQRALGLLRLEHTLAAATIDARRGDYEIARQSASNFFTLLRTETDKKDVSVLTPAQRNAMPALFAGFALTLFGLFRLNSELKILEKLRARHRKIQSELHGIEHGVEASRFSRHVKIYLASILLLEMVNIVILLCLWI